MMYDILLKIGAAAFMVIFFGLCIFIHELGHFLAAKWRGLYIGAFSIGFRKVWWKKIKGVEYRIGCIPVGGYVELPQIDASGDAKDADGNLLPKAKPLDRMIVAFAGPLFNMLFGLLLGIVIWIHGLPQDTPILDEIKVESVSQTSPEWKAGLREGDVIIKLNDEKFHTTWNGFINKILFTIGDVKLTVKRGKEIKEIVYKPAVNKVVSPEEEIAYPFFFPEIPLYLYPRPDSPAEKAGIKNGDRLLTFNGKKITGAKELESLLLFADEKTPVTLTVLRGEKRMTFQVMPVAEPQDGKDGIWLLGFTNNPVSSVIDGLPMQKAGLKKGDKILEVGKQKVVTVADIQDLVKQLNGKPVEVVIERENKKLTLKVAPKYLKFSTIGVEYASISHPNPLEQLKKVMVLTWNSLRGIGYSLGNTLHLTNQYTTIRAKHMSGPIGIGKYLFLSVYRGSLVLGLNVVVIITFNLGLINLLPIPVLDGGHILLAILQMLLRRPVSPKILEPISYAFISLLIAFMIFVSFYDVVKLFSPVVNKLKKPEPAKTEKVTPNAAAPQK